MPLVDMDRNRMADLAQQSRNSQVPSSRREFTSSSLHPKSNRLRLQTLVRLRWLAVAGQTLALLVVYLGFGFPLPIGICLAVVAVSVWLNIFLTLKYTASLRLRNRYATLLLAYDIIQLAALIALTGGLSNPFSLLFLVPTTVSASSLPLKWTLWLEGLTLTSISLVALFHLPLPWRPDEVLAIPKVYVFGIWVALVCALVFAGMYAWRIAQESRRMSDALAATQLVLAREQQLSALDGLAAAAAHELGTPLATIALVAKELKRELPNADAFADDLELLNSQAVRCREILSSLSGRGTSEDEVLKRLPLSVMLAEIANAQENSSKKLNIATKALEDGAEPIINRNPAILYGVGNLVKNALDFAESTVKLTATWDSSTIAITVRDDGPGFSADILNRLGEPYVTTRKSNLSGSSEQPDMGEGMGLGFFIAKTFLERTGASITLTNNLLPPGGAEVLVHWQRGEIEHED
jgi:two-component system, sensor histidine kinase RegB